VADPHAYLYPNESAPTPVEADVSPWKSATSCRQSLVAPNSRVGALLSSGLEQLRAWHRLKFSTSAASSAGEIHAP
jgi:hypothetical protein